MKYTSILAGALGLMALAACTNNDEVKMDQPKEALTLKVAIGNGADTRLALLDFDAKEGIKTDPVKITSIWKSGGYINLHLGVLTKGRAHKYHFLNLGKSRNSMGKATQRIQLFHSQEEDPEAYTREIFLSCPLNKLDLQSGDSIIFSINTYEGIKVYTFMHEKTY